MKINPLVWSKHSPPNSYCSYDHVSSDTPFGRFQIEWKSWKKYDAYCIYFHDEFLYPADDLEEAKEYCATYLRSKIEECINLENDNSR